MEKNKKENKIILFTTLGIIGAIIIVLGVTYAYWRLTKEQTGVNVVNSACLNVTMENQLNDINLPKAYPISDSDGLQLEPFIFTVKNNCEEYADYTISLEMLTVTDLNSDFVKIALNEVDSEKNPQKLSSYDEYEDLKLEDTVEGRTITSGKLEPNGEKSYELRIWLDGDVEVTDDTMNKTYKSKVVIESTIGEEPKRSDEVCNEKPDSIDCQLLKKDDENEEPQLMYDDTDDKNLRYVGASPNNYIDIGDKDSDGNPILWRIIGVMKNVYNAETSSEEDLIKIIRADSIGSYSWDTSASGVNDGHGVNEWSQADIMKLLNPESVYTKDGEIGNSLYWNNESGRCYSGYNNTNIACDFTSSGISEEARNKLAKVRWNTGTFATKDNSEWTASATYQAERGDIDGKQYCTNQGGGKYCNDEIERATKWDGYIGLINPSDFGYAVGKSVRTTCLAKSMYDYKNDGCYEADWLTPSSYEWTLNPVPSSSSANLVFLLVPSGYLNGDNNTGGVQVVRPVGFLKPSTTISDALGTPENPFVAP